MDVSGMRLIENHDGMNSAVTLNTEPFKDLFFLLLPCRTLRSYFTSPAQNNHGIPSPWLLVILDDPDYRNDEADSR